MLFLKRKRNARLSLFSNLVIISVISDPILIHSSTCEHTLEFILLSYIVHFIYISMCTCSALWIHHKSEKVFIVRVIASVRRDGLTGWPRHRENRENREFGSYFFQTGKTQGILLWHREKFWDTGKIFFYDTGKNLDTGKIFDSDYWNKKYVYFFKFKNFLASLRSA